MNACVSMRERSALDAGALFDVLDGREVEMPGGTWRIEAFSVGDYGSNGRWIQIGLYGTETLMLTLHGSRSQSAWQVLTAVRAWLRTAPAAARLHQVLEVA